MNPLHLKQKEYIGDGVYVGHDGYHVWLYTDTGEEITNRIALEPPVIEAFQRWLKGNENPREDIA